MDPLYPYALAALYRIWGRDLLSCACCRSG
jgi:hypothetical protein